MCRCPIVYSKSIESTCKRTAGIVVIQILVLDDAAIDTIEISVEVYAFPLE